MFFGIKKSIFITLFIAIVIVIGMVFAFVLRNNSPQYELATVAKRDVIQEVSITGNVEPVQDVDLAFEKNGRINTINVVIGDTVKMGDVLVELDNIDLKAQLNQAYANLASARANVSQYQAALASEQAKLNELKVGTRPEEIVIAETKVSNKQQELADAEVALTNVRLKADSDLAVLYDEVDNILNDAYVKADDAVNKQTEELFTGDTSSNPELSFTSSNTQAESDAKFGRMQAGTTLAAFKADIDSLSSEESELNAALSRTEGYLISIRNFLTQLNDTITAEIDLTDATANKYKGYITTGRTNINTALTNVTDHINDIAAQKITNQSNIDDAISDVNNAKNALASAEAELALKKAGATPEQIAAQEALVQKGEANVISGQAAIREKAAEISNIKAQLEKTILRAPFNGLITRQEATAGEIIAAHTPIVSVISEQLYEIDADVPEADINKIGVGYPVTISLDAFGIDTLFTGEVTLIEPSERVIQDVVYYRVVVHFDKEVDDIKPGMTADVNIVTAEKKGAFVIPYRAVVREKDGSRMVRVLTADGVTSRAVTTGIRSDDGNVEILSGLRLGESVIVREITK